MDVLVMGGSRLNRRWSRHVLADGARELVPEATWSS